MNAAVLHAVVGRNRYCVPGAVSAIAGITTDDAAARLRALTGKTAIRRDHVENAVRVLVALGFDVAPQAFRRSRLETWAATAADGRYVVAVTGHALTVVVADGVAHVCDNLTVYPLPLARYRHRRRFVGFVFSVKGGAL